MVELDEILVPAPSPRGNLGGIPLAFDDPTLVLGHWEGELGALLARFDRDIAAVEPTPSLMPATRERLELTRQALVHNRRVLEQVFAEARVRPKPPPPPPQRSGDGASLLSGWFQMLRDWGWHEHTRENEHSLEQVLVAMGAERGVGKLLVLGAGAGRLAYDLHLALDGSCSVLLDQNPLVCLVGRRVLAGHPLRLFEIPRNPRTKDDAAVERELRRPGPEAQGLSFVLGDARLRLARAGAFDTVLTPWYIDRVDQPLTKVIDLVHRALAPGGRFVHHGPLIYDQRPLAGQFTFPELLDAAAARGFVLESSKSEQVDYLKSELSTSARRETVHTVVWRRDDSPVPSDPAWPEGLRHASVALENFPGLSSYGAPNPTVGVIVSLVDGKRSVDEIGATLAPRLRMGIQESTRLVLATLRQIWRSV
jgi:SAM-dependent methyltransferase